MYIDRGSSLDVFYVMVKSGFSQQLSFSFWCSNLLYAIRFQKYFQLWSNLVT